MDISKLVSSSAAYFVCKDKKKKDIKEGKVEKRIEKTVFLTIFPILKNNLITFCVSKIHPFLSTSPHA